MHRLSTSGGAMEKPGLTSLGTAFRSYFNVVPALTDELRDHAFRIRHQVYCEELGFEPQRPNRRESDEYDSHSLHCLVRSVRTGEYVGCTRLVLTRSGDPGHLLPFERTCARTIDRSIVDPLALPRERIAEVSRLAIVSGYRRRRGEQNNPVPISDEGFGNRAQPRFPYLAIGLYLGTIELAALHGIDTLFVLTEPKLVRHFATLGVKISPIGGPVQHRGTRIPSTMSVRGIIAGFNIVVRPLYNVIAEEVRQGVREQRGVRQP
jgi:N-acyl amino acid synthase of PEP-CTERM/exosortase system